MTIQKEFSCRDKVIYPGHGVALIEQVIEKYIGESKVVFFKLVFLFKDMTILVPQYNLDSIGIRHPSNAGEIKDALAELYKDPEKKFESIDFTPSGWNRRNKDYQNKIQRGGLADLIKIYRDLMHVSKQKDLSFGERALLQTIEELIIQELQVVQKKDEKSSLLQELRSPFKQFVFEGRNFLNEGASAP